MQGTVWSHCRSLSIYLIQWKQCFKEADGVMVQGSLEVGKAGDKGWNQAKKRNPGMVSWGLDEMQPPCEKEKGEKRNAYK